MLRTKEVETTAGDTINASLYLAAFVCLSCSTSGSALPLLLSVQCLFVIGAVYVLVLLEIIIDPHRIMSKGDGSDIPPKVIFALTVGTVLGHILAVARSP